MRNDDIKKNLADILNEIQVFFELNESDAYDFVYDQIVSKAEFLSTNICLNAWPNAVLRLIAFLLDET